MSDSLQVSPYHVEHYARGTACAQCRRTLLEMCEAAYLGVGLRDGGVDRGQWAGLGHEPNGAEEVDLGRTGRQLVVTGDVEHQLNISEHDAQS